jgi:flagellar hook-associated protein 1 FlgK
VSIYSGGISALNIGSTALDAEQEAINIVGQNIANADTAGYATEQVNFQALSTYSTNGTSSGAGVGLYAGTRLTSPLLSSQNNAAISAQGSTTAIATGLSSVESVFPISTSGSLAGQMSSFWSDWGSLANDTTSTTQRSLVLNDASTLASSYNSAANQLQAIGNNTSSALAQSVNQVNTWAGQIAGLNQQIAIGTNGGSDTTSLQDQRDSLVQQISANVNTTTLANKDGSENVYINNQPLVMGDNANKLTYNGANWATTGPSLTWANNGTAVGASGGAIGGNMAFLTPAPAAWSTTAPTSGNSSTLAYYTFSLNQQASNLALAVNAQQAQGSDAAGATGPPIFENSQTGATSGSTAGITAGNIGVVMTDPSQLAAAAPGQGATTDNTNAMAFSEFASNVDASGNITIGGTAYAEPDVAYQTMVGNMGLSSQSATSQAGSATTMANAANTSLSSAVGVDTNQQLTDLVMYQSAYEAAAKYISTVDSTLQTLIDAM